MIKYLPISDKVKFRTYTYYSYYDAIVSNPYRTGKVAASIKVDDLKKDNWKCSTQKLHIKYTNKDHIVFCCEDYNLSMNGFLYRPLKEIDEQSIKIDYQQYSIPDGNIGFFISDTITFDEKKYMYQYGHLCMGDLVFDEHDKQRKNYGRLTLGRQSVLKIKKYKNLVCFYYQKGYEFELLEQREIQGENMYLGIFVHLEDNNYYDWIFNNYFQLKANNNSQDLFIEFDNALRKNWKYFTTNYYVNYSITSISLMNKLNVNICDYIIENIKINNYVEMDIDCYNVKNLTYYQTEHYKHTCLIYGFNDMKEELYLICVNKNGYITKGIITYSDMLYQMNQELQNEFSDNNDMIILENYSKEPTTYKFTKDNVIKSAKAFLEGESVVVVNNVLPLSNDYVYGINIYDFFKEHIKFIIEDIRITHLLVEHKQCMVERMNFMLIKEMIDSNLGIRLITQANELLEQTKNLQKYILKNLYFPKDKIKEKVEELLTQISRKEYLFMQQLADL
jgi:hypothetical protein